MPDYGSNAFSEKEKEKDIQKPEEKSLLPETRNVKAVPEGTTKVKLRLRDVILPEDFSAVRDNILTNVIGPVVRKMIFDVVVNSLGTYLFPNGSRTFTELKTSYDKIFSPGKSSSTIAQVESPRPNFSSLDVSNIEIQDIETAQFIIDSLYEILQEYGSVRVADFYDAARITCNNYTANNYGWRDISSHRIVVMLDGKCFIKMPRPVPLK